MALTLTSKYRTFLIGKRSGGFRNINSPNESLKILQRKLNHILQLVYKPKPSVHGFTLERNIVTNSKPHTKKYFVFNIDLKEFFPTVNFGRVRGMFMAKPYLLPPKASTVLAQICCHDNQLPQGAPTSPIISNMICARLRYVFSILHNKTQDYNRLHKYQDLISMHCRESIRDVVTNND